MNMKGTPLTLKERTIVLVINVFFSYIVFVCASKKWLPTGGLESVWFVSALALWFLTLLSAPWFIPPRDVFITAIGSALILVTVDLNSVSNFQNELNYIRWISLGYCVVVTLTALCALFFHDRDQKSSRGHLFFHLSGIFGKGAFLYTPPALISILGTYQSDISTVGWLINFWVLLAVFPSVQGCFTAWKQFSFEKTPTNEHPIVGTIDRIDHPNILRVRLSNSSNWKAGSLFVAVMPNEDQRYTLALFTQVQGTDVIGTGLCVGSVAEPISALTGQVCATHDQQKATEFIENISGTKGAELIGFTVENSTIGVLHFEVAASLQLEEGDVVFTKINNQEVFYQINDAQTSEESFDQNPRGTHIVKAAQIGRYDEGKGWV